MKSPRPNRQARGATLLEMIVASALVMVLASGVFPLMHWNDKRMKENQLKIALATMRQAIDKYNEYAVEGLIIQEDVDQMFYPVDLEELVEGVEVGDPQSPDAKEVRFLTRIPPNPFTGEPDWGMRSYQDDWDSTSWGGENLYDVFSDYQGKALDGSYYQEW